MCLDENHICFIVCQGLPQNSRFDEKYKWEIYTVQKNIYHKNKL